MPFVSIGCMRSTCPPQEIWRAVNDAGTAQTFWAFWGALKERDLRVLFVPLQVMLVMGWCMIKNVITLYDASYTSTYILFELQVLVQLPAQSPYPSYTGHHSHFLADSSSASTQASSNLKLDLNLSLIINHCHSYCKCGGWFCHCDYSCYGYTGNYYYMLVYFLSLFFPMAVPP